jgi:hypothetical protein
LVLTESNSDIQKGFRNFNLFLDKKRLVVLLEGCFSLVHYTLWNAVQELIRKSSLAYLCIDPILDLEELQLLYFRKRSISLVVVEMCKQFWDDWVDVCGNFSALRFVLLVHHRLMVDQSPDYVNQMVMSYILQAFIIPVCQFFCQGHHELDAGSTVSHFVVQSKVMHHSDEPSKLFFKYE